MSGKVAIINSVEKPDDMSLEDELAWALARIMRWPNPEGEIMNAYIPKWLAEHGKDALRRYIKEGGK